MPRDPVVYTPSQYVRPEYTPDTKSLRDLLALASQAKQQHILQRGQQQGQGRIALGALIANALGSFREGREQQAIRAQQNAFAQQKLAQEAQEKQAELDFRREQMNQPMSVGGRLLSRQGDVLFEPPAEPVKPDPGFNLSPGQSRFDASGKPVASLPPEVKAEPTLEQRLTGDDLLNYLAGQGNQGAVQALKVKQAQRPPAADNNEPLETIIGPDGKAIRVRRSDAVGKPPAAGTEKPSSGVQKHTLNFFNRARQADTDLEGMEAQIQKMGLLDQTRMSSAPNFLQSQIGQSYNQAQRTFTEARLRKDSGAAIPNTEFENDRKTYFAQPGDSPQTLEQKRRSRATVLASLAFESGQALGEFLGDTDEAAQLIQSYKMRSGKADALKNGETVTVKKNPFRK